MKTTRNVLILLINIILITNLHAQNADDKNIIISNQTQTFTYETGKNKNVVIKQKTATSYTCTQYRTSTSIAEFYNDQIEIDKVKIKCKAGGVKPKYDPYTINGIFYSDAKVCHFELPLSSKGEIAETEIEMTYLDPRYFTTVYLTESEYVKQKSVEIIVPRWMKIEIIEMNFGDNITKNIRYDEKNNADIYTYNIQDLDAFAKEPNEPGSSYIYPHLLILNKYAEINGVRQTYFNTLDDLYAWYHSLVLEIGNDENSIHTHALEITKNCTNDLDKIKTVYEWVQDNIRYIAFEDGIAGFKPAAAQMVLAKKYGDCKGMANLTKEILKSLGFDARLCWIGTNHIAYDYSTPSMAVDNHMICALYYQNKLYFLDATVEYIAFNQYPESIQNRQVLIENGEKYILERVPERTADQNTEKEKNTLAITEGALKGKVELTYKGESKEWFLLSTNAIKKHLQEDALTKFLQDDNTLYALSNLTKSDLQARNEQISLQYEVVNKTGVQLYDNEYYIDPDYRKEFAQSKIDVDKRKHDKLYPYKFHIIQDTKITLPKGYKVSSLPENLSIEREGYTFTIKYAVQNDIIVYYKEITFKNTRIKKKDFADWNADIDQLKKQYLEQIIVKK